MQYKILFDLVSSEIIFQSKPFGKDSKSLDP